MAVTQINSLFLFILGTIEPRFCSTKDTTERNSACRHNTSLQTDKEKMENPFLNLHPKIYYRKKNASSKMNIVKNKEAEVDLKSSALLRSNNKRDQQSRLVVSPSLMKVKENLDVGWETSKKIPQSMRSPKNDELDVGKSFNTDTIFNGQDELAYLNQRNISFSKYSSSEERKFSFPLIALPRNLSRESSESVKSSFTPSHESRQDILPRIRYGSFVSVVYEEERKKRKKMHKRGRETQKAKGEPQDTTLLNAPDSACNPCATTREIQVDNHLALQQECTSDFRGYRSINKSAVTASENNCKDSNSDKKTCNECNYHGENTNSDFMVLKAKLHRSSFT